MEGVPERCHRGTWPISLDVIGPIDVEDDPNDRLAPNSAPAPVVLVSDSRGARVGSHTPDGGTVLLGG
jgi:hypothetical protein